MTLTKTVTGYHVGNPTKKLEVNGNGEFASDIVGEWIKQPQFSYSPNE